VGVTLEPAYEQTAVHAAEVLGLNIAGVDMLHSKDGPMVLEVNSSPGLEGIERATNVDVAGAMIDYVLAHAPHHRPHGKDHAHSKG
jgi:ribosomal protein S6--L-glutamate ligase